MEEKVVMIEVISSSSRGSRRRTKKKARDSAAAVAVERIMECENPMRLGGACKFFSASQVLQVSSFLLSSMAKL